LANLTSARKSLRNLLLFGCRQSLPTRQEGLLLRLRELAKLSANLTQSLGAGHFLLNRLLLGRAERLTAGQNCLLLGGTKTTSRRGQLSLPSGILLGGRDSLSKTSLQSLRLLAKN
jgi:hypothetical protein